MKVGAHVSISGSIDKAVDNAVERDCTAFQIFTRSPRSWHAKDISSEEIKKFKGKLKENKIDPFSTVAHMPYLPNLSSPDELGYKKSVDTLVKEMKRCDQLGVPYLVAHLGSHRGTGEENGIKRIISACLKAYEASKNVMLLLENTAGQKNSVGSDFEQLNEIFSKLKSKKFGICLDTCHAFAAGYDLRGKKEAEKTLKKFNEVIGFEHLKILHLNDSKGEMGCNLDRHEHIGLGKIGEIGLGTVINTIGKKKIPIILETPIDDRRDDFGNIKKVKELANIQK